MTDYKIQMKDVHKSFGDKHILRGVDLNVEKGTSMVIIGGSGNNWGAVLGGFLVWFFWTEAPIVGLWLLEIITSPLAEDNALRLHLLDSAAFMRLITMGLLLLVVLRFSPRGLLPEKSARR